VRVVQKGGRVEAQALAPAERGVGAPGGVAADPGVVLGQLDPELGRRAGGIEIAPTRTTARVDKSRVLKGQLCSAGDEFAVAVNIALSC
jgi:hypothetical protein